MGLEHAGYGPGREYLLERGDGRGQFLRVMGVIVNIGESRTVEVNVQPSAGAQETFRRLTDALRIGAVEQAQSRGSNAVLHIDRP